MTTNTKRLGIIVSGATSTLVAHQHLPALTAIRNQGGLELSNGDRVVPDLMLVGRNAEKLAHTAASAGIAHWSTDLDAALSSREHEIFFDASASAVCLYSSSFAGLNSKLILLIWLLLSKNFPFLEQVENDPQCDQTHQAIITKFLDKCR